MDTQVNREKAAKIKILVTDVDGVLTNGSITYDSAGHELKSFNAKDGMIVKYLQSSGILVGVITGRKSEIVSRRCEELKVDFYLQGISNKLEALKLELDKYGLELAEVAYIGDDLNDLSIFSRCGLSATPNDAPQYIRENADIVLPVKGGEGVYRVFADFILNSQEKLAGVISANK